MPTWLRRRLEATGKWDSDGTTRAARARTCRRCHTRVLVGLDADRCAMTATVDVDELDPVGELTALLAGRETYTLAKDGPRLVLDFRDQWRIAGAPRGPVFATHICPPDRGTP